jgi:hypothetical protein
MIHNNRRAEERPAKAVTPTIKDTNNSGNTGKKIGSKSGFEI